VAAGPVPGPSAPDEQPSTDEQLPAAQGGTDEQPRPAAADEPWDEAWLPQWTHVPGESAAAELDQPDDEPIAPVAPPARRPLPPRLDAALAEFRHAELAAERAAEEQAAAQLAAWEEAIRAGEALTARSEPTAVEQAPAPVEPAPVEVEPAPVEEPAADDVQLVRTPPAPGRRRTRLLLPLAVLAVAAVLAGFTLPGSSGPGRPDVAAAEHDATTTSPTTSSRAPRPSAVQPPALQPQDLHPVLPAPTTPVAEPAPTSTPAGSVSSSSPHSVTTARVPRLQPPATRAVGEPVVADVPAPETFTGAEDPGEKSPVPVTEPTDDSGCLLPDPATPPSIETPADPAVAVPPGDAEDPADWVVAAENCPPADPTTPPTTGTELTTPPADPTTGTELTTPPVPTAVISVTPPTAGDPGPDAGPSSVVADLTPATLSGPSAGG
jgi:hypothetical protein